METFLRRLTILAFLSSSHQVKSTQDILQHLIHGGYIDDQSLDERSMLRVIQRDLKFLLGEDDGEGEFDNLFGLECVRGQGKSLHWRLDPYAEMRFDFEKMPRFMALAFTLTRKHLGNILPRGTVAELQRFFAKAEERLEESEKSLTPQSYKRMSQAVEFYQRGQPLQAAPFDLDVLDTIYRAIMSNRQVAFEYREKSYQLHPYGVVILLPKIYLIGVKASESSVHAVRSVADLKKSDYRSFLLHKISAIHLTTLPASVPEDFSLQAFLKQGNMDLRVDARDDEEYVLKVELNTALAGNGLIEDLRESPISQDQVIVPAGPHRFLLSATVHRTIPLRNWILSLGPAARVVEPETIRQDLLSHLQGMMAAQSSGWQ